MSRRLGRIFGHAIAAGMVVVGLVAIATVGGVLVRALLWIWGIG
jgi:hypothetical protein